MSDTRRWTQPGWEPAEVGGRPVRSEKHQRRDRPSAAAKPARKRFLNQVLPLRRVLVKAERRDGRELREELAGYRADFAAGEELA